MQVSIITTDIRPIELWSRMADSNGDVILDKEDFALLDFIRDQNQDVVIHVIKD